jgi:hypothetical protein
MQAALRSRDVSFRLVAGAAQRIALLQGSPRSRLDSWMLAFLDRHVRSST